jgi:methionyl-tRNA synthetase
MNPLPAPREYLLLPMQPTPNGRLHLGHAAGPYLRADVLARHLRRDGHTVQVICGSDVYENWILLDSVQHGRTPEQTCLLFNRQIQQDLAALDFAIDEYVNPLDGRYAPSYVAAHENILAQLIANHTAHDVTERFPVSTGSGRYVVGVWLFGRCPNCGVPGGGNCCEDCGYHYQPGEILDPRSRLDEGPLEWREEHCWYLVPPSPSALLDRIAGYDVPDELLETCRSYVGQTGGKVRLTIPSEWGIKGRGTTASTVLCNTYYNYSVYCGTRYRRTGAELPELGALAAGSGITTVGLFGVDNTIGGLVASTATALAHGGLAPFGHVAVNYFLDLEGSKFSTSRHHGIWITELREGTSVTADEIRWHLSHVCPETGPANFEVAEFVARVNELRDTLRKEVVPALELAARAERAAAPAPVLAATLDNLLAAQAAALREDRLRVRAACTTVDEWFAAHPAAPGEPGQALWWLRSLALLAEPFLPGLAGALWTATGGGGRPARERFAAAAPAASAAAPPGVPPPLTMSEIEPYVSLTGSAR